jgi:hypothetical protein
VVPNRQNRQGQGVDPADVHSLGASIVRQGWTWSRLDDPICFQVTGPEDFKFYQDLVESSDGMLADGIDASQIRGTSAACTHTCCFLNCVNFRAKTELEHLARDGRFCKEKV